VLKVIERHLRPGALVVADNLNLASVLKEYVDHVGLERNGYLSMQLPIGDRLSVSLRLGSR
jgi:predicted O-methyltransferase YrrM